MMTAPAVSIERVTAACLAASAAAATPAFILGPLAILAFPIGFVIAGFHVGFLGVPLYLVLRRWFALNWLWSIAGGFVVGACPYALLALPSVTDEYGYAWGWSVVAGGCGAIGGLFFRAVIGRPTSPTGQPIAESAANNLSTSSDVL